MLYQLSYRGSSAGLVELRQYIQRVLETLSSDKQYTYHPLPSELFNYEDLLAADGYPAFGGLKGRSQPRSGPTHRERPLADSGGDLQWLHQEDGDITEGGTIGQEAWSIFYYS